MSIYQPLKGISDVFEYTLSNDILDGLVEYFDWSLMEIGNYFNVEKGELAPNGEDYSQLRLASSGYYPSGQSWEGFRKNWIWQSGISYATPPIVGTDNTQPGISGVYVNDIFEPVSGSGPLSYYVDYTNGRIIFNSPIPTGSNVQVEHSYKWINVVYANNVPWLRQVQINTEEPTSNFLNNDKGAWNIPPESRLQLPAIAIEIVPMRTFKGYQLGGGQWVYTDVLFHCIAEDEVTRNKLIDIVSLQNDKIIPLFDSNRINASGQYPVDYRGVPTSGALRYPELVENYYGGRIRLKNGTVQGMTVIGDDLFGGTIRFTTEGVKSNI